MRRNVCHHWTCCGIHHNGCGVRMLHNILRFCTAKGTVNRHQNGTNLHQSKPDIEKFRAVGQHHTHAVASADTQAEESTGDPIDRGVKVGIGCDLVLKDQERFFGVLPDTTFQELSDVHKRLLHSCLHVSHACLSCSSSKITQYLPVDILGRSRQEAWKIIILHICAEKHALGSRHDEQKRAILYSQSLILDSR